MFIKYSLKLSYTPNNKNNQHAADALLKIGRNNKEPMIGLIAINAYYNFVLQNKDMAKNIEKIVAQLLSDRRTGFHMMNAMAYRRKPFGATKLMSAAILGYGDSKLSAKLFSVVDEIEVEDPAAFYYFYLRLLTSKNVEVRQGAESALLNIDPVKTRGRSRKYAKKSNTRMADVISTIAIKQDSKKAERAISEMLLDLVKCGFKQPEQAFINWLSTDAINDEVFAIYIKPLIKKGQCYSVKLDGALITALLNRCSSKRPITEEELEVIYGWVYDGNDYNIRQGLLTLIEKKLSPEQKIAHLIGMLSSSEARDKLRAIDLIRSGKKFDKKYLAAILSNHKHAVHLDKLRMTEEEVNFFRMLRVKFAVLYKDIAKERKAPFGPMLNCLLDVETDEDLIRQISAKISFQKRKMHEDDLKDQALKEKALATEGAQNKTPEKNSIRQKNIKGPQ